MKKLLRQITVKVIHANGATEKNTFRAKAGHSHSPENEAAIVDAVWQGIAKGYPTYDYEKVSIGPGQYNFVCRGRKASA